MLARQKKKIKMKILCKAFAKVQFSTVSLYGTMRKGKKEKREKLFAAKAFAKVQFSYSISLGYYEKRRGKKKKKKRLFAT